MKHCASFVEKIFQNVFYYFVWNYDIESERNQHNLIKDLYLV